MIVVDTNVVSEMMKEEPSPVVREWIRARRGTPFFTTAVTVAEIRYGIERLPKGRRRKDLGLAADRFFAAFADSILAFDTVAAGHFARIVVHCQRSGRQIDTFDAQIAAICQANDAPLATGNIKDFRPTGVKLVNPWTK